MRYLLIAFVTLTCFLLSFGRANATPVLSVSSPDDLTSLTPGQSVSFTVTLSGLETDDALDFLAADLRYDPTLFSAPTTITPGAIIPDANGFLALNFPDGGSGLYDVLPLDPFAPLLPPITTNGKFFSFEVTVLDLGQGSVTFSSVSAFGFGPLGPIDEASDGGSLPFNVQPASEVPEPTSLLILAGGGCALLGRYWLRRRNRVIDRPSPRSPRCSWL